MKGSSGCIGETELEAAARLQRALLPATVRSRNGWSASYRYSPAGPVGGDLLDLIPRGDVLYFLLADVSGKGVAASILTGYLHAIFRTLVSLDLPVEEIVRRASAQLCASTLSAQYATLVFGSLDADGTAIVVNAGHPSPLLVGPGTPASVVPTGAAAGLFCDSQFTTATMRVAPGETMFIYSDGLTDAFNAAEEDFGADRVLDAVTRAVVSDAAGLIAAVGAELAQFLSGALPHDDLTMLAIRFQP